MPSQRTGYHTEHEGALNHVEWNITTSSQTNAPLGYRIRMQGPKLAPKEEDQLVLGTLVKLAQFQVSYT